MKNTKVIDLGKNVEQSTSPRIVMFVPVIIVAAIACVAAVAMFSI